MKKNTILKAIFFITIFFVGSANADICQDDPEMRYGRAIVIKKVNNGFNVFFRGCTSGQYVEEFRGYTGVSDFPTISYLESFVQEDWPDKKLHPYPISMSDAQRTYIFRQDWILHDRPQNCVGKEWSLGRGIETSYKGIDSNGFQIWKAKIGVCNDKEIEFVAEYHWQRDAMGNEGMSDFEIMEVLFGPSNSNNAYGEKVEPIVWLSVPSKSRTYYVFSDDYQKWIASERTRKMQPIVNLLMEEEAFSPDNPMSGIEDENDIYLDENSWQNMYPVGTCFIQVDVRPDGAKVKFVENQGGVGKVYAVYRNIPVYTDWTLGEAPFDVASQFLQYSFEEGGRRPDGSDTEWTVAVIQ